MRRTLLAAIRSFEVERARGYTGGVAFPCGGGASGGGDRPGRSTHGDRRGASGALAAGQQHNHFRDVGTFVDTDFCETGQTINGAFNVVVNELLAPHNGGDEKIVTSGKIALTNPLTGDTAIQRFAGPVWNTFVSGDPDGVHVEQSTVNGLPEMWKLEHGRRLMTRRRVRRDPDDVRRRGVRQPGGPRLTRGRAPTLESDFELFCETLVPALGIS